jgi:hypothetical protein
LGRRDGCRLTPARRVATLFDMATETIKSTYTLDVDTVRALARRWNVTKSEALRRAMEASAERATASRRREARHG